MAAKKMRKLEAYLMVWARGGRSTAKGMTGKMRRIRTSHRDLLGINHYVVFLIIPFVEPKHGFQISILDRDSGGSLTGGAPLEVKCVEEGRDDEEQQEEEGKDSSGAD